MISGLIQQVCSVVASLLGALPVPGLADGVNAVCGQIAAFFQALGL